MNVKALLYGLIVILALSLILAYAVFVLTAWNLEGYVIDYNGEPVPHATVTFTNYEETFKVVTDDKGYYSIPNNLLSSMEEGRYHVIATKKIDGEDFVGYEGDFEVEKKNTKFNIYFKNKNALNVYKHILDVMKGKFNDLRPVSSPSEPEKVKMKYESKTTTQKDTVDLKDLGDYYILLKEDDKNGSVVHIDLMYGNKVVEEGDVILNCSLFAGWTRPEGHHPELWNSIGLDEVSTKLTKNDGTIKIWTKYTWLESGDRFSDVIISPLNVYNERTGKNKAFFSFVDGLGYKFTQVKPKPGGEGGGGSSGPPEHGGLPEGVEVDLSNLGEYTIQIYKPNPLENKVCIRLMKGKEVVEKSMCIVDTNFWTSTGESIESIYRTYGMFSNLKNTIGIVGAGKIKDENTIELSKDDGIIYITAAEAKKICDDCNDVRIISKEKFDKYFVISERESKDDKNVVWYKERWMLGSR